MCLPCPYPQPPLWHEREANKDEGVRAMPSAENVCEDILSKLPELNSAWEDVRLIPSVAGKAVEEDVPDDAPPALYIEASICGLRPNERLMSAKK